MIAVIRPLGEMVIPPFEVGHTDVELSELSGLLRKLDGETRVVMEATGNYHMPVASFLYDSGFYIFVVNAMLIHGYGNNSLRRAETDKKDAIKLANYGLDHWLTLPRYIPEDEVRLMLKTTYRRYQQYATVQTMLKNNLISLLDTTFPDANRLFTSHARADGSEKWVDFVAAFPHCECVCELSGKAFKAKSLSVNRTCADCAVRFFARRGAFPQAGCRPARKSNKVWRKRCKQAVCGLFADRL